MICFLEAKPMIRFHPYALYKNASILKFLSAHNVGWHINIWPTFSEHKIFVSLIKNAMFSHAFKKNKNWAFASLMLNLKFFNYLSPSSPKWNLCTPSYCFSWYSACCKVGLVYLAIAANCEVTLCIEGYLAEMERLCLTSYLFFSWLDLILSWLACFFLIYLLS